MSPGALTERARFAERANRPRTPGYSADASLHPARQEAPDFVPAAAAAGAAAGSARASAMFAERIEKSFVALRSFTDSMLARPILTAIKSMPWQKKTFRDERPGAVLGRILVPPNVEGVMRDAVDAANKTNLAIYTVDTAFETKEASTGGELDSLNASQRAQPCGCYFGGVSFRQGAASRFDQDESTLRFIANSRRFPDTQYNDFEVGLQRIDEDIRAYYISATGRLIWNLTASS